MHNVVLEFSGKKIVAYCQDCGATFKLATGRKARKPESIRRPWQRTATGAIVINISGMEDCAEQYPY